MLLRFPLFLAAVLLLGCRPTDPSRPMLRVVVATGAQDGYYHTLCGAIRDVGLANGLNISCQPSNGSQDNIYRLERHNEQQQAKADFALVQADVAHRAWQGELPFYESHRDAIRLVTPLITE